jgi:hypothetical protein
MSLTTVIGSNNKAVHLIQHGKPSEAVSYLRCALKALKIVSSMSSNDNSMPSCPTPPVLPEATIKTKPDGPTDICPSVLNASFNDPLSLQASPGLHSGSVTESGSDLFGTLGTHKMDAVPANVMNQVSPNDSGLVSVYDRAIVIAHHHDDCEVVTAVILYNMALLHHTRGIQLNQSKCILRATKFYHMALSIVMPRHHYCTSSGGYSILVLALFNNLAHAYSYTYDVDHMSACMEYMRQTLTAVHYTTEESVKYSVFTINVMCAQDSRTVLPRLHKQ